jgi:antitoxin (DNA-binding transcriptional repressor) of toxin-antitoxin stability system
MPVEQQISQRDLRLRSREIMDAVERGETFTITRDGREIGEFVPLRRKSTFLSREEVVALGRGLPSVDADRFRADLDEVVDPYVDDPFTR